LTAERAGEVLVIGAGPSGATIARVLAEGEFLVTVAERAPAAGGLCHTSRDPRTGIMVHTHGPHIFHSDDRDVWAFVERFATFRPYRHHVIAVTGGKRYPLPITLDTMSAFFGRDLDETSARQLIASLSRQYESAPKNFEEQGRQLLGDGLYEAFFEGYTRKQWGVEPDELPAAILKRIPVRFNHDQNYFHHGRVAIPAEGYTAMMAAMLDHPNIRVRYNCDVRPGEVQGFAHTVYTGPLDAWFGHCSGRLQYRTLAFEAVHAKGTFQDVAQVNYCDMSVPWTRITEHKHFTPWEEHAETVCFIETSRECSHADTPYYPVRLAADQAMLKRYLAAAREVEGVSFVGRLATYRYIDMDVAIGEALQAGRLLSACLRDGRPAPAFFA
jgi:UDP-galactopyranose mutase